METLRGFVSGLQQPESVLYSSPNRITDDTETRRISFSKTPLDYFEFYWAHHMEEPGLWEIMVWSLKLLFIKTPSTSLKKHIGQVRLFIVLSTLVSLGFVWLGYTLFKDQITGLLSLTTFGASLLVVLKIIWSWLSATLAGTIQSSIGDVIKYTVPSPKNIAVREKVRKNGLELIRNLHDAKKDDGSLKYSKIVVVAHSLGTVVAYDILTSLFADYHTHYLNIPDQINQEGLDLLFKSYGNPNHIDEKYQNAQAYLFQEYQQLGNQWRVNHFVTLGSPLAHASMILSKGAEDFNRKKDQREFPISPPQLDHDDKHYVFSRKFKALSGEPININVLHHAAFFAMTQWTNIYFKNDWIGGPLASEFGKGIHDIRVEAGSHWLKRIPLASHTFYWDTKHPESLNHLKNIFDRIRRKPQKPE
jgi:hypothetical protein